LDPRKALRDVRTIVALGPRAPGTEGERKAFSWIGNRLEDLGYKIEEDNFRIVGWQDLKSELVVNGQRIRALTFGYSPPVEAEGELVCLRSGREDEYVAKDVRGKLVLVEWGSANMRRLYWNALVNGAAAVIIGFTVPHLLRFEAFGVDGYPLRIPVTMIALKDHRRLSSRANRAQLRGRLRIRAQYNLVANSMNLSALKKGRADEEVIALAHVDCWYKGANDNASTVSIVLQMAELFSEIESERGIRFLFTGSEEAGDLSWLYYLKGAAAYIDGHPERIRRTVGVVNGDITGNGERLYVEATPELATFASSLAQELHIRDYVRKVPPSTWQETFVFTMYGLPAICLMWASYNEYHTSQDVPTIIDRNKFLTSMKLATLMVGRLARNRLLPYDFGNYAELIVRGNEDRSMSGIMTPHEAMKANPGLDSWTGRVSDSIDLIKLKSLWEELAGSYNRSFRMVKRSKELAQKLSRVGRVLSGRLNPLFVGAVISEFGLEESTLPTLRILDDVTELTQVVTHLKSIRAATWDPVLKSFISYFARKPAFVDVRYDLSSVESKLRFAENMAAAECKLLSITLCEAIDLLRAEMK
jgi:Iap family predicted aminopeptidase